MNLLGKHFMICFYFVVSKKNCCARCIIVKKHSWVRNNKLDRENDHLANQTQRCSIPLSHSEKTGFDCHWLALSCVDDGKWGRGIFSCCITNLTGSILFYLISANRKKHVKGNCQENPGICTPLLLWMFKFSVCDKFFLPYRLRHDVYKDSYWEGLWNSGRLS